MKIMRNKPTSTRFMNQLTGKDGQEDRYNDG